MVAILEEKDRGLRMKNKLRKSLELVGINLARNSHSLGLTPYLTFMELLLKFKPKYNGWDLIRIGAENDGGYLIPNDLENLKFCFSPGSDLLWQFEEDLADNFGIKSYICDSADKKPANLSNLQEFTVGWLGPATTSNGFISLSDWVTSTGLETEDKILQIDIEGSEYLTLLALPDHLLETFRIIVIELHFLEALKNRWAFELVYKPFFEKIFSIYDVVHTHPNNCCGTFKYGNIEFPRLIEVTLHRKNRAKSILTETSLPHTLDSPCVLKNPELLVNWSQFDELEGQK
jgi:hypothetical protein